MDLHCSYLLMTSVNVVSCLYNTSCVVLDVMCVRVCVTDNSLEWEDLALPSVPVNQQGSVGNTPPAPSIVSAHNVGPIPLPTPPDTEAWQTNLDLGTNHEFLPGMQNTRQSK
jgi:hypothetical protein